MMQKNQMIYMLSACRKLRVNVVLLGFIILHSLLLTGCLSGFKPRGELTLPAPANRIMIEGLDTRNTTYRSLRRALQEYGSKVETVPELADSILKISNFREERQVSTYDAMREVRQYLLILKFDYEWIAVTGDRVLLPRQSLRVDRTQDYDSDYVLGKVDEASIIRDRMRMDAARLVILRLKYGSSEH